MKCLMVDPTKNLVKQKTKQDVHGHWRSAWHLQLVWHKCQFSADLFHSNIWPSSFTRYKASKSDLEFDLSMSLKVICDNVIGLAIYAFLSMFNSNLWPNSASSQNIRPQNLSDLEFDFSMFSMFSTFKCDVIGLVIHGFLLIYTVIICLTLTV